MRFPHCVGDHASLTQKSKGAIEASGLPNLSTASLSSPGRSLFSLLHHITIVSQVIAILDSLAMTASVLCVSVKQEVRNGSCNLARVQSLKETLIQAPDKYFQVLCTTERQAESSLIRRLLPASSIRPPGALMITSARITRVLLQSAKNKFYI